MVIPVESTYVYMLQVSPYTAPHAYIKKDCIPNQAKPEFPPSMFLPSPNKIRSNAVGAKHIKMYVTLNILNHMPQDQGKSYSFII